MSESHEVVGGLSKEEIKEICAKYNVKLSGIEEIYGDDNIVVINYKYTKIMQPQLVKFDFAFTTEPLPNTKRIKVTKDMMTKDTHNSFISNLDMKSSEE